MRWNDGTPATAKVDKLDRLRGQVMKLDTWETEGPPVSHGWFMYQGDELFQPLLGQYMKSLEEGFVRPSKQRLEEKLRAATGAKYLEDYNNLKTDLYAQRQGALQSGRLGDRALTQVGRRSCARHGLSSST